MFFKNVISISFILIVLSGCQLGSYGESTSSYIKDDELQIDSTNVINQERIIGSWTETDPLGAESINAAFGLIFYKDGSYIVTMNTDGLGDGGNYWIEGDTLFWEGTDPEGVCFGNIGSYRLLIPADDRSILFLGINDDCESRWAHLDSLRWYRTASK